MTTYELYQILKDNFDSGEMTGLETVHVSDKDMSSKSEAVLFSNGDNFVFHPK